jgi:nucleoside-diphosphate-sugar epimerase
LHDDDAVRAFALAAEKGRRGDVYNVGSGDPVRIADLARKLADIMGLMEVNFECTMENWPGDIKTWFADLTKIVALGFMPQTSRDEGLRRAVDYLVEHPTY